MTVFHSLRLSMVIAISILSCGVNIQAQGSLIQTPAQPALSIEPYSHERDYHDLYRLFNENRTNLGGWGYDETFPTGNQIKVARFDGLLAGFVIYKKVENNGYIDYVAVDQDIRSNGLGKILLHDAIYDLKLQGAQDVSLNVYEHNVKAQSLYERLGFYLQSVRNGLINYTLNFA